MIRLRRLLPTIFALIIALRAIVPVGYMLQLPGQADGVLGFSMVLCPSQNQQLDFSQLGKIGSGRGYEHHHHTPTTDAAGLDDSTVDAVESCGNWLNSSAAALNFGPAAVDSRPLAFTLIHPRGETCRTSAYRCFAQPRAPPTFA